MRRFRQYNRPAAQTSVRATQVRLVDGERTPVSSFNGTGGTTDDRGVYRIYGLPPGEYIVSATPRLQVSGDVRPITEDEIKWARQQLQPAGASPTAGAAPAGASAMPPKPGQAVAYTPVYYSGTTDDAAATLVTVTAEPGAVGRGFLRRWSSFPHERESDGTVVDQNRLFAVERADQPSGLQGRLCSMVMGDPFFMLDTGDDDAADGRRRPLLPKAGVRPGQYTLTARAAPRAGGPGSQAPAPANGAGRGAPPPALTLWASTEVSVDGTDQSDIALRLQPGMTISGRIAFDGSVLQPPADLAKVTIRLTAAPNPSGVTVSVNVPSAPASADGTFKLEGVTPGRYFLSASAPAATPVPGSSWIVRSAMVGDVNAADRPFEVRPDEDVASAIISFTDKTAGDVRHCFRTAAGRPTPEFSIFLFPHGGQDPVVSTIAAAATARPRDHGRQIQVHESAAG